MPPDTIVIFPFVWPSSKMGWSSMQRPTSIFAMARLLIVRARLFLPLLAWLVDSICNAAI